MTTEGPRLSRRHFGEAAGKINRVATNGHGRTLTCVDHDLQALAAIAYHLDRDASAPLLVTAIGIADGPDVHWSLCRTTEVASVILLACLSRAARLRGAPAQLGLAAALTPQLKRLGFAPAAAPNAYATARTRYLQWHPAG